MLKKSDEDDASLTSGGLTLEFPASIWIVSTRIRTFENSDRAKIRKIAASTATGYPRSDLQLVADLLTDYYINYEPDHLLVAENEGRVAGYLTGCLNSTHCRWVKATRVIPKAIVKAVLRGEVGRLEVRYLFSFVYVSFHGGLRNSPPEGFPAHFHINVEKERRGEGIGTGLVERFFSQLKTKGVKGVHVRVRQGDRRASRFFKSLGFSRVRSYPTLVAEKGEFRTSRSVIYVKQVNPD